MRYISFSYACHPFYFICLWSACSCPLSVLWSTWPSSLSFPRPLWILKNYLMVFHICPRIFLLSLGYLLYQLYTFPYRSFSFLFGKIQSCLCGVLRFVTWLQRPSPLKNYLKRNTHSSIILWQRLWILLEGLSLLTCPPPKKKHPEAQLRLPHSGNYKALILGVCFPKLKFEGEDIFHNGKMPTYSS